MSTDVLAVYGALMPSGTEDVQNGVQVGIRQQAPGEHLALWQQVDEILRASVGPVGFRHPDVAVSELSPWTREATSTFLLTVAPDVIVSPREYQERYSGIDLEHFRNRMPAELFAAFVRYMGLIPGHPDLDVSQIATIPE